MNIGRTKEYRAWTDMKRRCLCANRPQYRRYGARGIGVWGGWVDDFQAFLRDVGPAPSKAHSLDRIDNDGHYEPGNVRWATPGEQSNNHSSNVNITIDGVTKTAAQWAADKGMSPATIRNRVAAGWDGIEAVAKPSRGWRRTIEYKGEHKTEREWSITLGIPATTIRLRARKGLPLEKEQTNEHHIISSSG